MGGGDADLIARQTADRAGGGGKRERGRESKFKCCCNKCRQAVSLKTLIETVINGEVTKNGVRNSLGAGSYRVTQDSTTNYSNPLNENVCSSRLSHLLSLSD